MLVQVVEAIVGPGDVQAITQEIPVVLPRLIKLVGEAHFKRRFIAHRVGQVPCHAG
ncbi:hypothetical protein D3C85_1293930 [compost metagenome]